MNWYYVDAGQQAGPVDDAQLDELLRAGKIQADTLVWHEGMANWLPYTQAKAPAAPPASPDAPPVTAGGGAEGVCSECGRIFSVSEMIRHGSNYVCAACKPVFMQKLSEGVASGARLGGAGMVSMNELLARDYEHDLGGYFSRAWETFKSNAGIMIGASVLVYFCIMAANFVPYLSMVLSIIFTGPLMGGLWNFYLKKVRGQDAGIGDAFSGFGPRFGQLLLGNFIPGLLAGLCMLPIIIPVVIGLVMFGRPGGGGSPFDSGMGIALICLGGLLALGGFCAMMYFTTCWMFTLPLVADKGMNFWAAMSLSRSVVRKHWWMNLLVIMVIGLIGSVGMLACLVGLLVSGPVAFAMLALAYDKLFGDLAPQS